MFKIKFRKRRNKKVIIIFVFIFFSVFTNCVIKKNYTNSEKENIKKLDSMIYENKIMREIDYNENLK